MYKVFLVDDEIVIREGIRDNVKWQNTNFIFSGEASDGEMALPLIQEAKPDILLTDIKMPFMDGLELSRILRKSMPWVKIIILSGHDEFNYAREALYIGVTEYLLKPITSAELIEALNRVALQIEREKREKEDMDKIKKQLEQNKFLLRDKFFSELLQGVISTSEVIDGCTRYGINIISKYYLAIIMEIELDSELSKEPSDCIKAQAIINGIVCKDQDVITFQKNMDEAVLILKGDNDLNLIQGAYSLSQAVKDELESKTSCKLNISIGQVRERVQGISQSYKDADKVRNHKYVYGKNRILCVNDVEASDSAKKEFIKFEKDNVRDFMKSGKRSEINLFVEKYAHSLNEVDIKSLLYIYYLFMDVILDASHVVKELGGKLEDIFPDALHLEKLAAEIDSITRFKELIQSLITKVIEFREVKAENKYWSIIAKAKEYIGNNFSDPDISLNAVAAYVNVSPSHFSTIFSHETGENFIEYLTKVRMNEAMALLKMTSQKSAEIAYKVGYNDSHYFSYIFKKIVGKTPKEYRNEN
jgi:two-component system response regulator YesN